MATPISASKASLEDRAAVSTGSEASRTKPHSARPTHQPGTISNAWAASTGGTVPTRRSVPQGLNGQGPVPRISCLDQPAQICPTAGRPPPPGLGFPGSEARTLWLCPHPQACSPPPRPPLPRTAHLSIRMASVRLSFSSQVSLSSAMIFSVSWGARPSTVRSQGVCACGGGGGGVGRQGVSGCRGAREGAAKNSG